MIKQTTQSLLLLTLLALTAQAPPAPLPKTWPAEFAISFTDNMYTPVKGHKATQGRWYYSWTQKAFRIDRNEGSYNHYCGAGVNYQEAPCSIFVKNGKRYIHYPTLNKCCFCCANENGCGIMIPDWFKGSTYEGTTTIGPYKVDHYLKIANEHNLISFVHGTNTIYQIFQQPESNMIFDPATIEYSTPSELFDLPSEKCEEFCPEVSPCTQNRKLIITATAE